MTPRRLAPLVLLGLVAGLPGETRAATISWSFDTGGALRSAPAVTDGGLLFVGGGDGVVYALSPAGSETWSYPIGGSLQAPVGVGEGGEVYVGADDNQIYTLDASGAFTWSYLTRGDVRGAPALDAAGDLRVGSRDDRIYRIDALGTLDWEVRTGGDVRHGPALGTDGTAYVASYDGKVWAVDASGATLWTQSVGAPIQTAPALGADGTIYVGADDNQLHALSPAGALRWSYETDGDVRGSPVIGHDGTVYFGSDDGAVYAVDPSGALVWRYETGADVCAAPVVDENGIVYAASTDGSVYTLDGGVLVEATAVGDLGCVPLNLHDGALVVAGEDGFVYTLVAQGGAALDGASPWPVYGQNPRHTHRALDGDGDGMADWWESTWGLDPDDAGDAAEDTDADGLTHAQEHTAHTDPTDGDSDDDALSDADEVNTHGSDPRDTDTDDDTLPDGAEVSTHGTDPTLADTDGDGMSDAYEITWGLAPTNAADAASDPDADGYSNLQESLGATNPGAAGAHPSQGTLALNVSFPDETRSSPTLGEAGEVYVGASDGKLYRFTPGGAPVWSYQTSDLVYAPPTVGPDGRVYVGSLDNTLYTLDDTGALVWSFDTAGGLYGGVALGGGGEVYLGSADHTFYALDEFGALTWSYETGGGIYGAPAVSVDGDVVVGSGDGKLYRFSGAGVLEWSYNTGADIFGSPALDLDGVAYVGSSDKRIYAITAAGTLKWRYLTGGIVYGSPVLAEDGTVYVGSDDGYLYAMRSTGALKWRYNIGDRVRSSPAVGLDGTVYVGAENGRIYALNPTGTLRWSLNTGSPVDGSMLLTPDGLVYTTSRGLGLVAAFTGESDGLALSTWPMRGQNRLRTGAYLDSDGDGMGDGWESYYGLDPDDAGDAAADPDTDGLTNLEEYDLGADPTDADTDGDGLTDGAEVDTYTSDPTDADSDDDTLTDGAEVNTHGTSPIDSDSDDDWMDDGAEVGWGFDPMDPSDGALDADGDGFSNVSEYLSGTDPTDAGDGPELGDTDDWRLSEASLTGSWASLSFGRTFTSPVLFHGVPNSNDPAYGVPRIKNITTTGAQMRFQEWGYLDGTHAAEDTAWLAVEPGLYQLPGGDLVEVGTFTLTHCYDASPVSFSTQFPGVPHVFVSGQTAAGTAAVTFRLSDVTSTGFSARMYEQESTMDDHNTETIGYLALYSPTGAGTISINGVVRDFTVAQYTVSSDWAAVGDANVVRLEEEQSYDTETTHPDETVSVLSLDGALFGQSQGSVARDTVMLRRFQRDLDTLGPFEVGTMSVDDAFTEVLLTDRFADPVVLVGPAGDGDTAPGVVRVDALGQESFSASFQEWDYLDGVHPTDEALAYTVWEAGRWEQDDGTIVEVGHFPLDGTGVFETYSFTEAFPGTPSVFLSVQTYSGVQGVLARSYLVTTTGFDVAMYEQESYADTHNEETIGYVAVYAPAGAGEVDGGTSQGLVPFALETVGTTQTRIPIFSESVRLEEEQSKDSETTHSAEQLAAWSLDGQLFTHTQSGVGFDPYVPRRRVPEAVTGVEWGTIRSVNNVGKTVVLKERFTNPVVIARAVYLNSTPPGTVRVSGVSSDRFDVRYQAFSPAQDGAAVQVLYMVFEAGTGSLGALNWEAGRFTVGGTLDPDDLGLSVWSTRTFATSWSSTPAVLTAVMSENDTTAAVTRLRNVSTTGFDVILQEAEIESVADQMHAAETVGWVAVKVGQSSVAGRLVWSTLTSATNVDTTVTMPATVAQTHAIAATDMHTSAGTDCSVMRFETMGASSFIIGIQEEQTVTAEMNHLAETVSLVVLE